MINEEARKGATTRLKKIEGQIRGIMKMVESEKDCIDIINQITAAEKALSGVSSIIMRQHVESGVTEAVSKGKGKEMINELIDTIYRYGKN